MNLSLGANQEPLYDATLGTMGGLLLDADQRGDHKSAEKWKDLQETTERFGALRGDRASDYAVIKHIVVHNLYGVDIEEQATEIAKLRLFLKLVSLLEPGDTIEPLPDIDFNIRHGNTLVGYATEKETEAAIKGGLQTNLAFDDPWKDIRTRLMKVEEEYHNFQIQQVQLGGHVTAENKKALSLELDALEEILNSHLCRAHGTDPDNAEKYDAWKDSHKPLHWYVDFYPLMASGGFDAVIGNPPYVELRAVNVDYTSTDFTSIACGDLYALCTERALQLLRRNGQLGLIVPISIFGTDGFTTLQQFCVQQMDSIWTSFFANRPSQLFEGAQKRLTVLLGSKLSGVGARIFTSTYIRWRKEEFETVFRSRIRYAEQKDPFSVFDASLEKLGSEFEVSAFSKIRRSRNRLGASTSTTGSGRVYYTRKFGYFLAFLDFIPEIYVLESGERVAPSELKELSLVDPQSALVAIAILSSSTFFWFWNVLSDCRNVNRRDLLAFPMNPERLDVGERQALQELALRYIEALKSTSGEMQKSGLRIQTFKYSDCKPLIDQIDEILSKSFGLSAIELDFIVNYDIKYRMGTGRDEVGSDD